MASTPSVPLPLQQRLLQLAQTLQCKLPYRHLTLLFSIIRYAYSYITLNYYSGIAIFSYRAAFVSAAATYGIVVYKAFRARARATGKQVTSPIAIAADENVQYLADGTSSSKTATKPSATADTIGRFVKEYYDSSMGLVASLEIALWSRIFLSAIFFSKGSWALLVIYTVFLRARYAQSSFVQDQFRNLEARIDSLVGAQSTPLTARQAWDTLKSGLKTFHDTTDVIRSAGRAPIQKKAS
ncbi:hypothetical protein BGHDH14_bgh01711 [Blumeria hordei DH14]|uniref:Endoplasmic reticulum protein n=1 Tax=Blumeria graminis f. sp. hordei (strain DH14) TaxID=546991 RepID=N1JQ54_BLUG1|nr:hypothetical protein BGHDH14_bgh01711 [Blumeria hordei DH14]